jgi:lipopolysaccharide/colanic/teichoic acid biosynthesis glycosyltransferase
MLLPAKLALSLAYLERRTLRSDLGLLLRTVFRVARGGRAHSDASHVVPDEGRRARRAALG